MNRIFITLLTALFVLGFAGTAAANHHNEDKADGAHAECTHAADEACPHANSSEDSSATQCTKHAEGEACNCDKSGDDHAAHG